jgi:3-oxoacyl-[acyl-carrier protein] reductase
MFEDLQGKSAIVTGGSRGIGAAISRELAKQGVVVAVNYNTSPEAADSVVQHITAAGGRAQAFKADVSKPHEVEAMVTSSADAFGGKIDILVNNAGAAVVTQPVLTISNEDWKRVFEINLDSVFYMCKAVVPLMPDGGAIVNITSLAARFAGRTGRTHYATTKGALLTFTRGLAKDLAGRNIRVNAVAPGLIDTDFDAGLSAEFRDESLKAIPLGRSGVPEDIAPAVVFLSSAAASFVTGESFEVNGGQWFV